MEFLDLRKTTPASEGNTRCALVKLVWHKNFCCGNQIIDTQHQLLFKAANELLARVLLDPSLSTEESEIAELITQLVDDIRQHFHDEEKILKSKGFPGTNKHAEKHEILIAKACEMSDNFRDSVLFIGDIFQFLAYDVIMLHMLRDDKEFFPFV